MLFEIKKQGCISPASYLSVQIMYQQQLELLPQQLFCGVQQFAEFVLLQLQL